MPETKEQTIARLRREVERLEASLNAATRCQDAAYHVYGPEQDVHMAKLTVLDDIIGNPRRLHAVTLCTAEQFDYILHRYTVWIREHGNMMLFWDDDVRVSDPGNRSKLYIRRSLLLSLMRKQGGNLDWAKIKRTIPDTRADQEKGVTLTSGGPGPPSNHTKTLHTAVLLGCARPSVSGVIKACRL